MRCLLNLQIIFIFLFILGGAVPPVKANSTSSTDKIFKGEYDSEIKQIVLDTSQQINNQLPMMIDEETRFDFSMALNKQLHLKYTMINSENNEMDIEHFKIKTKNYLLKNQCRNKNMKILLSLGIEYFYNYFDKDGDIIASIKIGFDECNSN